MRFYELTATLSLSETLSEGRGFNSISRHQRKLKTINSLDGVPGFRYPAFRPPHDGRLAQSFARSGAGLAGDS
jgi:hypothetical protein